MRNPCGSRPGRAPQHAVVERGVPEALERNGVGCVVNFLLPSCLHVVAIGRRRLCSNGAKPGKQYVFALPRIVDRAHGGLAQAQQIRGRFEVSPCLEPVVLRKPPPAVERGLILVEADTNFHRDFRRRALPCGCLRERVGGIGVPKYRGREGASSGLSQKILETGVGQEIWRRQGGGRIDRVPLRAKHGV